MIEAGKKHDHDEQEMNSADMSHSPIHLFIRFMSDQSVNQSYIYTKDKKLFLLLFRRSFLRANIQKRNARIVIANLARIIRPRVDMHVLVLLALLALGRDGRRHVHVVQLLVVHVEQVRVALEGVDVRDFIQVVKGGDVGVGRHGGDEGELVEVAGGEDARGGVEGEDLLRRELVYVNCFCFHIFGRGRKTMMGVR